jgi:hypothetical protein
MGWQNSRVLNCEQRQYICESWCQQIKKCGKILSLLWGILSAYANMMALKYIFIETFSFSELSFECGTQLAVQLPVCCISSWSGLSMVQGPNLVQPVLATNSTWDFFDQDLIWKFVWRGQC